jgi:hypothetical protein
VPAAGVELLSAAFAGCLDEWQWKAQPFQEQRAKLERPYLELW